MKNIILFLLISISAKCQMIGNVGFSNQNYQYTPEYQRLLNYSVNTATANTPSYYGRSRQDAFLRALQSAGILAITDVLHVKATNGSPVFTDLNWVNPGTNTATRVNTPLWVKNAGFQTNASSNYTNENFAPNGGTNYTQNSAEVIWGLTGVTTGGCHGGRNGSNFGTLIIPKNAASQALISLNSANATINDAQFDGSDGLYFVGRTASNSMFGKHNSGSRVTSATNSQTLSSVTIKSGALDTNGTISLYAAGNCTIFWAGGLLTTTQESQFITAYNAYIAGIQVEVTAVLGTRYTKNTWSNLSDFTNNGSTAAVVSNAIQLTGGTGAYTKTLDLNGYTTCQEYWTITVQYNMAAISGSSTGLGIGIRSNSSHTKYDFVGWCSMTTGSIVARMVTVVDGTPNSAFSTNTSGLTATASDTYQMIVQRAANVVTISIQDITTSSTIYSYSFTLALTSANFLPNTGNFSLFDFGGTINVTSLTVSSQTPTGATYAMIGDSKCVGYFAGTWGLQVSKLLGDYLIPGVSLGGGADESADIVKRLQEIIDLAPQVVIVLGMSNDPRFGVSSGTTNTNMDNINTTLTGAGLRVVWVTGLYETAGNNQTNIQTHITTTYPNYIDILGNVITLNGDGIHPDGPGFGSTTTSIINSGKFTIR